MGKGQMNVGKVTYRAHQRINVILCLALTTLCGQTTFSQQPAGACGPKFLIAEGYSGMALVLCEERNAILRLDIQGGTVLSQALTAESPFAACLHPDGQRIYVSCRRGQQILELDVESLATLRSFELRGDPTGLTVSADGKRLYAGVHSLDQIAVWDIESGREIKRLASGNGPESVYLEPKQGRVYVTNLLSNPVAPDEPPRNEITVIDDQSARVIERIILEGANVGRGIAFAKDGSQGIAAISRPKNLVPMVQVARGWVVTNGFVVLSPDLDALPVQLLVDLPNRGYSDPHDVAMTPDGRKFYLSCAGADTVIAVDMEELGKTVNEALAGRLPGFADHLGLSRRYVTVRIKVGANPQALAIDRAGQRLLVANRLDDTITVIDTVSDEVIKTIALSENVVQDRVTRGKRLFHSAARTFQGQFSCASCHPDDGFDGLQYDLEPDGLGKNVRDNRNLRDVAGTAPFKWTGTNPDITTQCGTRTAKWIVRTGWIGSSQVVDLAAYIRSLKPVVNPYRSIDGQLTPAQLRGKMLFERTTLNDGTPLSDEQRCNSCHAGPKFFDGRQFDVGTKAARDTKTEFDTAHLVNIFESPPYLHDGRSATLEEMWTVHNPSDEHGVSSDWTKRQLNDLVEYLKSL
jgi:YVTN family beta-propeller protein